MASGDKVEIIDTINAYAIVMNSRQWDLFDDILTPDAVIDFGGGIVWNDLDSFKAGFAQYHGQYDASQHITSGHVVRVEGDEARCLSYVHGHFIRAAAPGGSLYESTGWYDDRLVRTPGGWRIAERRYRMIRWSGNAGVMQLAPGKPYDPELSALHRDVEDGTVGFFATWGGR